MSTFQKINREFFCQPTLKIAREILGKFLVHELPDGRKLSGMIIEAEAYIGPCDRASHAYRGKRTARNEIEYGIGGHVYIYLVYGMHWQFNIVTADEGKPECILIRALTPPLSALKCKMQKSKCKIITATAGSRSGGTTQNTKFLKKLTDGPGKLCRFMHLDKGFYGYDLCQKSAKLYVEDRGVKIKKKDILATPRVGIDYAGAYWAKRPWRFLLRS